MHKFVRLFAIVVCLAVCTRSARADWVDTFTGGFEQSWVFFDNGGSIPPDQTIVSTSGDALVLVGDPAGLLSGSFDAFSAGLVGLGGPQHVFTDLRLTGTVSTFPQSTVVGGGPVLGNNDAFLLARSNGASGYVLNIDFNDGAVDLVRSDNGAISGLTGQTSATIANFDPNGSYTLELTAIGNLLEGRVYDGGNLLAMVSATDDVYTSGYAGVGAAINENANIGGPGGVGRTLIAASFDNVSAVTLPIPEPSSFLLFSMAALALLIRRR